MFSTTLVVYAILGYYYILSSMISLVAREFRRSKFVDILSKLIRIREDEEESFNVSTVPRVRAYPPSFPFSLSCSPHNPLSPPSVSVCRPAFPSSRAGTWRRRTSFARRGTTSWGPSTGCSSRLSAR